MSGAVGQHDVGWYDVGWHPPPVLSDAVRCVIIRECVMHLMVLDGDGLKSALSDR